MGLERASLTAVITTDGGDVRIGDLEIAGGYEGTDVWMDRSDRIKRDETI